MVARSASIDFVKGILIVLMILFHIVDFTVLYPMTNYWIYSFHMPVFLILSGYLFKFNKNTTAFFKSIRGIVVPYFLFCSIYLVAQIILGSYLGARTEIDVSNVNDFILTILFKPKGTYWYLHTLAICMIVVYVVGRVLQHNTTQHNTTQHNTTQHNTTQHNTIDIVAISTILLYLISLLNCGIGWPNIQYFVIGVALRGYSINIEDRNYNSLMSIIPILIITICSANYSRAELSGIGLSIFMLSFLIAVYSYTPKLVKELFCFLGRNTLSIVLFSPMILIFIRFVIRPFSFDPTNIVYALMSTILGISFCIIASIVSDKLNISKVIVGKNLYTK